MSALRRRVAPVVAPVVAVVAAAMLAAPAASARPSAYVTVGDDNAAGVAAFDLSATGGLTPKAPPLVGPPNDLEGVAMTPDGRAAYVALNSSNPGTGPTTGGTTVLQFAVDRGTGALTPLSPASVASGTFPTAVAVSPDGRSAYVTAGSDNAVSQYDIAAGSGALAPKATPTVATGDSPFDVALTPNGRSAYVSDFNANTISQYDADATTGVLTPKAVPTVSAPGQPLGLAVTADGRSLFAASGPGVLQFDIGPGTGALAPKAAPIVSTAIPSFVSLSPDGRSADVDVPNTNRLNQYDVGAAGLTPKSPPSVAVGSHPFPALANAGLTPDSRHALVLAGAFASLFAFDADAGSGALSPATPASVTLPAAPLALALTPDVPVAAFAATTSGLTATFDASASSDTGGSIARFDWDFGDGSGAANAGPSPTHTYATGGAYTATLTVTSAAGCTTGASVYLSRMAACTGSGAQTSRTVTAPATTTGTTTAPTTSAPVVGVLPITAAKLVARTSILSRSAVVTGEPPDARAQIRLACRTRGTRACRGRLRLLVSGASSARAARLRPGGGVRLARATPLRPGGGGGRFAVRAGRRARVTLRIDARTWRALAAHGRLRGALAAVTRQPGRRSARTRRAVVLRLDGGRG